MRFFLIFLLQFFYIFPVYAEQIPYWVKRTPSETATVRYYRGFGEGKTKSDAIKAASEDAKMQALAIFGLSIESSSEVYQTMNKSSLSAVSSEKSAANLVSFDRQDIFVNQEGTLWEAYVLYSYPKTEIEKEKKRLDDLKKGQKKAEFSVVGSERAKGVLKIDTKGIRAPLYIDGRSFGYTPVELIGQLSVGDHKIRIDDPAYETFEHTVVIVPNKTVSLPVKLIPAFAYVTLKTNMPKAEVSLNGKSIGKTPLVNYKVPTGKELIFEVKHAEAEVLSQNLTLDKNEERELMLNLQEKRAKLSVFSFPEQGASIILDGQKTGKRTPLENFSVPAGKHKITLYKEGFEDQSEAFDVKGGEKKSISVSLKKMKKSANRKLFFDKAHTYTYFPSYIPKMPHLKGLNTDEKLKALMEWNAVFPFLKAKISYAPSSDKKSVLSLITVYIDKKTYQETYIEPLMAELNAISAGTASESELPMTCFDRSFCALQEIKTDSDVYLRTGSVVHSFWSDKAAFMRFPVLYDVSLRGIQQRKTFEVYGSIFDKNSKSLGSFKFNFDLQVWQKNGRNIVFSPFLTEESARICVRKKLLRGKETFSCGAEELLFYQKWEDISADKIDRIYIAIGVKAQ